MSYIKQLITQFDLIPELKLCFKTFIFAIFLGVFLVHLLLQTPEQFINLIEYLFQDLVIKVREQNLIEVFWFIFTNNLSVSLSIIVSALIYRYLPLFFLFSNGVVLGLLVYETARLTNNWLVITYILPHGIFELPALLLTTSIGVSLGRKSEKYGLKGKLRALIYSSRQAIFTSIILLLVAAAIEATFIVISRN